MVQQRPVSHIAAGSTDKTMEVLNRALEMWKEVSSNCTASKVDEGDKYNTILKWRGHQMAMLTLGVDEVAVTYSREVNPPTIRLGGVSMLTEKQGREKYGRFCAEISYLESMINKWPTVLPDAYGNIRLLYGKGEYGRVEVTPEEVKYRHITGYSDTSKKGNQALTDLRRMMAYTLSIVGQIDKHEQQDLDGELNSLMEL